MKRLRLLTPLLSLILALTACGGTPAGTVDPAPAAESQPTAPPVQTALDMDYEGALSQKLLLSLGTMELANTAYPPSAEQAAQMLFYWQTLNNMTLSGNSAPEEVNAILAQIEAAFTPEQIAAINRMQLTTEYMQTWAQQNGITMGTGTGTGGGQGQGSGMDPDARATKQASEGITGSTGSRENGLSAAINNALIAYLESIQ